MSESRFLSLYVDGRCTDCGRHISPPSRVFGDCPGCSLDRAAAQKDATAHGAYLASCNWCNTVVAMAEPLPFDMAFLCSRCHQRASSPALPAAPRGTWS